MTSRPRIGVIAYEMEGRPSGVGRFLEGLLGGLVELGSDWTWLLFCKGEPFAHPLFAEARARGLDLQPVFDCRPGWRPIPWEQLRLPGLLRAHHADAVFSPGYSLPLLSNLPGFLALHDLAWERRPEEFGWRERWRRRFLARRGVRSARRVLASSRFGATELHELYGVPLGQLRVLPAAVAPRFFAPGEDSLADLGVRAPYLLWLATLLPRRPIEWALQALAAARAERPELHLVVAGADRLRESGTLARLIAGSGVAERVIRLDWVPEERLPDLYRGAELTLYPSAYEGFGLPPLESLAAGTAPVITPGQALEELWPDYPYCAPFTALGFVAAVRAALADPARHAVVARGRELVAGLTWRASARALVTTIAEALGEELSGR